MDILIIGIVSFLALACYIVFSKPNVEESIDDNQQRYGRLFFSNNKNSYRKARDVYEIVNRVDPESSFLEETDERL